jgi:hypothetical protein
MLNLNYNINKAIGGGGCIGVMKFNYSASIDVRGGQGGGNTTTPAGGGGGAGMAVSQSISVVPNITYQIFVGSGGLVDTNGQDSYLFGYDDSDKIPISFYAGGGFSGGDLNGGNSGTGSIVRNGIVNSYPGFTGGIGFSIINAFGPQKGAGGGASNSANGGNGSNGFGGTGAGGGGAFFNGPTGPYGNAGTGIGGDGYSAQTNGVSTPRNASAGINGTVIIAYAGQPKAIVTNATTTFDGGSTTHTFASGNGTFTYPYPYPWSDVQPYQVVLCPPLYE